MLRPRILLLYAASDENATFSYQRGWPRQFAAHPRFDCTLVNVADRRWSARARAHLVVQRWRGDAIVLLHSVFSNQRVLSGALFDVIRRAPQPKAYFIGNEYKLMPEKMRFCEDLGVSLLISQSSSAAVHRLYCERLGCRVIGIPNTGLDPALFTSTVPWAERPIDLGYRADASPMYLGHQEREVMAEYFLASASKFDLRVDISLAPADRFAEPAWATFLNRCKGQLGTEAGGDFFELTDATRDAVNAYVACRPHAPFEEIWNRFFREYHDPVPLRIISGRNIEAAGTRTVQVLFEGHYDGYFHPDEHYIPLEKDFSNIDDVLRKFRDPDYCRRVTENAYQVALSELTYTKLIDRFAGALASAL